ncbi:MAG: hypothetical protein RIB32_03430 [Phycisphaerales bacterium]
MRIGRLGLAATMLMASATHAQVSEDMIDALVERYEDAVVKPQDLDQLVADLDADDLAVRDRASAVLTAAESIDEEQIVERWRRDDISPEQRLRLERALRSRFASTNRAGMGIRFGDGVIIDAVVDGFPVARQGLLRPGDRFVQVDGRPVSDQLITARTEVVQAIISYDPGDLIPVTIFRPDPARLADPADEALEEGDTIQLLIPLGDFSNLAGGVPPQHSETNLREAWELRMRRFGAFRIWLTPMRLDIGEKSWVDFRAPVQRRDQTIEAAVGRQFIAHDGPLRNNYFANATQRRAVDDEERAQFQRFREILAGGGGDELLNLVDGDPKKRAAVMEVITNLVEFRQVREEQRTQLASRQNDPRSREIIERQLEQTNQRMSVLRERLIELVGDAPMLEARDEKK